MLAFYVQRDDIGIGGPWSEFMDYVMASLKSQDVKLILDGNSNSDSGYILVPCSFYYFYCNYY